MGINCELFDANVWQVAFEQDPESPCFLCAKMREGVLYKKVEELGCNKLALGHHFDDVIETTLINLFYAKHCENHVTQKYHKWEITNYTSSCLCQEQDIKSFMKHNEIEAMSCGCPVESDKTDSKRKRNQNIVGRIGRKESGNIKQSIFPL